VPRTAPRPRRTSARRPPTLPEVAAVLQASVGDRLHAYGLAAEMRIVQAGRPFAPTAAELKVAFPHAGPRITVWLHGLGVTEAVWRYPGRRSRTTYGSLLEREEGFTPVFLRYNSGRSIRDNGTALDALLEALVGGWPMPLTEIALIGYSMGGLVVRSALQQGAARSASWVPRVRHTIHLGVPHLGAPLERAGRVTTSLLRALPNPFTKLVGAVAALRSAGVKDLAHGDLAPDGAWVPLPPGGVHHAIVGTLHDDPDHPLSVLLGDGLVPVASARGRTYRTAPVFAPERILVLGGLGHLTLPRSPRVYRALRAVLTGRPYTVRVRRRARRPAR